MESVRPSTVYPSGRAGTGPDAEERWYAVRVRSRCEKLVAGTLENKGYEEFLPLHKVRRQWSDRVKVSERPLFPGYVFCRFPVVNRLPILTTPAVVGIVGIGPEPLPVEDEEIASLKSLVRSGFPSEPCDFFGSGDRVRVVAGPLAGLEGVFLSSTSGDRLVVSVSLLCRSVAVELEAGSVAPASSPLTPYAPPVAAVSAARRS